MTRDREPLPTKDQIAAISDLAALQGLRDDIEARVVRMETDLEYREDDDDWVNRASAALAIHKFTIRLIDRRMAQVRGERVRPRHQRAVRSPEDTHPLTRAVIQKRPDIAVNALTSVEEVDHQMAWLVERIEAVTYDREDEITLRAIDRDEGFMAASGNALRQMKGIRQLLQNRRGELSRAAKKAEIKIRDDSRPQLFVDMAREVLDRDTFLAIWERVDRIQAQPRAA
jgi:hypothetical protein